MSYQSTKIIDLGSCAFRQWKADHSHCKFIHGYRLQAKFWFGCSTLDNKNWVVDFGGLKELKAALEKQFDHTLCIAADDPLLEEFKKLHEKGGCDLRIMPDGVGIERTAEWCFKIANEIIRSQTNNRCWVDQVEVWEHDKNSAIFKKGGCCKKSEEPAATTFHTITPLEQTSTVVNAGINVEKAQETTTHGAPLRSKVSSGYSNLFGGTSWGV